MDPSPRSLLSLAVEVLARPAALIEALSGDHLDPARATWTRGAIPRLLALVFLGAGLFGLAVGTYRGGIQVALSALKMPFVLLSPLLVTLPALRVLHSSQEGEVSPRRAGMAALVGAARVAILASALVPLVWLLYSLQPPYRASLLFMAASLALVGIPGLFTVGRALAPRGKPGLSASLLTVGLCGLVIAQSGWLLRPFVVTPGARVSFLCPIQEDVFTGLLKRIDGEVALRDDGAAFDCALPEEQEEEP